MIYTPQVKIAMDIAYSAHHGQRDKGGMPYIFHPIHLAEQMDTEVEVTAALLHDVVEDTPWTMEQLRQAGISQEVLNVLELLTHPKGMPYMDYVRRILPNPTARKIKLADIRHNGDFTRLGETEGAKAEYFRNKYREARLLLESYEEK